MDPLTIELAQNLLDSMQDSYTDLEFEYSNIQDKMAELELAMEGLREAFDL